ncbi:MAG: hypothetical protein JNJ90_10765 [Saprospiraceae bacterium]|jgi:hypothetical protein|nr:hypothetical protein [Saprospiraceae bacterium]
MTLAELDEHIKTFKRRVNDPQLSEAQRAAFQAALEGAEKQRLELLAAQAPTVPPKPERSILKPPVDTQSGSLSVIPPVAVEPDPSATPPEVPAPTGGPEKKTMVRSSAPVVGTVSMPSPDTASIVVECDLEGLSKTVIVFRWGKIEERLSPGVAMGRFKARVADVARLKNRRLEESRCFRRAVGYYVGLCRFYGRELTAGDFGFRGKRAAVFESVQSAAPPKTKSFDDGR